MVRPISGQPEGDAMPTHPRRHAEPKAGRRIKLAAIWLVIVTALGGFGVAALITASAPPDAFAVCERGGLPVASTVIMVDTSDELNDVQRKRVKATVGTERDRLPRGGRLTVLGLNPEKPWEPLEIVSACNPGTAADANPIFVTRSRTDKQWSAAFGAPIEAAIIRANSGPASPNSPIIATIAAALTRPDFDSRTPNRRLILISDMLEHQNGAYSQLKGGDLWRSYQSSPPGKRTVLDLRGTEVAIDYLARPQYAAVQGTRHREFWRRLFAESGATGVTFVGLPPDEPLPQVQSDIRRRKH
jgi:hypothetical protein